MDWHSQANSSLAGANDTHEPDLATAQLSEGKGDKKKITRSRISYSCHECRKRKVKCDKAHPRCNNCLKSGEACTYDVAARPESEFTPSEVGTTDAKSGTKRRREFAAMANSHSPDAVTTENLNVTQTGTLPISVGSRIDRLAALVEALRQEHPSVSGEVLEHVLAMQGEKTRSLNGSASPAQPGEDITALKMDALSLEERDKRRLGGIPFFAYVAEELGELNQLLRDKYVSATSTFNSKCQQVQCQEDDERHEEELLSEGVGTGANPDNFNDGIPQITPSNVLPSEDCISCQHLASDKIVFFRNCPPDAVEHLDLHNSFFSMMPTKHQSHILFRAWYSAVHSIIPIDYPPVTLEKYERFWDWFDHKESIALSFPDPSFIPMLCAIWYAGSLSIPVGALRKQFGISRAALSKIYHDEVVKSLARLNFPRKPSLPALAAYLIIHGLPLKEEEPLTTSSYVGLAIRVAQTLGLHRDPKLFGLPMWEAELRRRLWWHILHADLIVSIASGLPPMIGDDQYWDVRPISELKDSHLRSAKGEDYMVEVEAGRRSPDPIDDPRDRCLRSMIDVRYVVARSRYRYGVQIRQVLKVQLGVSTISREEMQRTRIVLQSLEDELNEAVQRIPTKGLPENGFVPKANHSPPEDDYDETMAMPPTFEEFAPFMGLQEGETSPSSSQYLWKTMASFHDWARIMLSMLIDRAHCFSYAPFLKQSHSKLWRSGRQCALLHCHGYMRKFISLASDASFQPFRWSWPGCHQPMHSAIILLVDLYERPQSVEALNSRAFIDQVYALSNPESGIIGGEDGQSVLRPFREGGTDAWEMLRRLRTQAWRKAGLEPKVLWTTEDMQIAAGIGQPPSESERILQNFREGSINLPTRKGTGSDAEENADKTVQAMRHMIDRIDGESEESIKKRRVQDPNEEGRMGGHYGLVAPYSQFNGSSSSKAQRGNDSTLPQATAVMGAGNTWAISSATSQSDLGSAVETTSPSRSCCGTDATSVSNVGREHGVQPDDISMDAVFDWEAWDSVFGQQPTIDDVFYDTSH